jgi:hypothetical protein
MRNPGATWVDIEQIKENDTDQSACYVHPEGKPKWSDSGRVGPPGRR